MTVLGVGRTLRDVANTGLRAVAAAEDIENANKDALEAQKIAAASQTMGTGAGIGGMIGATKTTKNALAAKDAVTALNAGIGDAGTVGMKGGGLTFTPPPPAGTAELVQGAETIKGVEATAKIKEVAEAADAAKKTAEALKTTTEVVKTGTEVAASTSQLATTAGTAASSTGTMATMATLAAPIAIGLGVSFLISKLFD
jgi:hypothetical protein|tara:strand:+ start:158 stop:754 length:597 start_codon:yes stop_codon:yes gene_type:complete